MKRYFMGLMLVISSFCALVVLSTPAMAQQAPPTQNEGRGSAIGTEIELIKGGVRYFFTADDDENPEKSLQTWMDAFGNAQACWGCELYQKMQDVTLEVGQRGEKVFTSGAIAAMNAFMGLWVVFQLYLLLSPTHANGPAQSINTIFQRIVLMMIVLAVLHAGPYKMIMTDFVLPSIDGILLSAQAVMGTGGSCNSVGSPGAQLICSMHIQMGRGMGLGAFLIDDASLNPFPGGDYEPFQLVGGLIIFICFAWMMIMLPFRLFDALIRIAVVSVILPVVVLAYQFKPTRGACKQAVTSVLAAALTFLFTAIAVAIATELLSQVAGPVIEAAKDDSNAYGYVGPIGAKEFMVLIASACGMAAFIKQAGTIAGEFAGFQGSMGNTGNGGAAAVAGAATLVAGGAGYGAMKAAGVGIQGVKALAAGKALKSGAGQGGGAAAS